MSGTRGKDCMSSLSLFIVSFDYRLRNGRGAVGLRYVDVCYVGLWRGFCSSPPSLNISSSSCVLLFPSLLTKDDEAI